MKTHTWASPLLVLFIGLILTTLLLPIPASLMDVLILFNISLSFLLLVKSLYVGSPLQLASFPALILITTLLRLGTNIASTRLILSEGEAGHLIALLGQLTTQGNLMVGLVVFGIITLIQFIIIAKGSERVAEVAARFTLDALPGKQMSIDADLRAGIITQSEAKDQREALHSESRFYGAMDGAMKFIKGDAIACILIIFINLLGGFYTGVMHRDLSASQSALLYSTLTIGEGLISQVASILVALTAGFLITRVHGKGEIRALGGDIAQQILSQPQVYHVVAAFILTVGLLPGIPLMPFFVLALLFTGTGLYLALRQKKGWHRQLSVDSLRADDSHHGIALPLILEMGPKLYQNLKDSSAWGQSLSLSYPKLRLLLSRDMGVEYPELKIRVNPTHQGQAKYTIRLFEIPVESGYIALNQYGLFNPNEDQANGCDKLIHTEHGTPLALWDQERAPHFKNSRLKIYSPQEIILRHLGKILKKHSAEFIDIQQVRNLLTHTEEFYPELVREVIPRMLSLQKLTEILKRLVEEGIPIRDMRLILQSLAFSYPDNKDPVYLTEQVRIGLRKTISHLYAKDNSLNAFQLSPQLEDEIRASIQRNGSECYVALAPERIQYILSRLDECLRGRDIAKPSLLTSVDIRRYVKKIVDHYKPDLPVVSFQELDPKITIAPLGIIG